MNIDRYRARHGDRRALDRFDPADTGPFKHKDAAEADLEKGLKRLGDRQRLLYAQDQYALLLIFQGMDAAGKDHVIRHVMSGIGPQGTEVHSFKEPSTEELQHDYLWRAVKALPPRGRIGVFNRSHYEEVLVVRVHKNALETQHLPHELVTKRIWDERFEDINAFEQHLARNGTIVRKFYLHVSRGEQRRRLLERLDDPSKNWKFSSADILERADWRAHHRAACDAIASTSHRHAPWFIIPADHKWFSQALVAEIVVQTLDELDLSFPKLKGKERRALGKARRKLGG